MTALPTHWRVPLWALALLVCATISYQLSMALPDPAQRYQWSYWLGIVLFTTLMLAPLFIYPALWLKQVPFGRRMLACYLPLGCWLGKEVWRVTEVYTLGEAFYLLLNPLYIDLLLWVLILAAFSDPLARAYQRWVKRVPTAIWQWSNLGGLILAIALFISFQLVGLSYALFYQGQAYQFLFGGA